MTPTAAELDGSAVPDRAIDRARLVLERASLADVVVAGAALLLIIVNAPGQARGAPVLLTLVLWPLGGAGLVGLALLARRGDQAARWGAAFVVWALVATLASDQPQLAFFGGWAGDRGWVFLAAFVGCWAVGRRRGATAIPLVTAALVTGLVMSALLALVQVSAGEGGGGLVRLQEGRTPGFTSNPVYFGGLMSGGVALSAALAGRASSRRWWGWLPVVALLAAGVNLSGSRAALAGAVILGVGAAWRSSATGGRRALVVATLLLGLVVGGLLLPNTGSGRLASDGAGSGGVQNRVTMWAAGIDAAGERPVTGWGPNRFRPATSPAITADFVRNEGVEGEYTDAHNVVVELLVTTGLPGLVAAGGFAWLAARVARGPLGWYAAGVAVTWLLEPVRGSNVPTAMLALGLAAVAAGAAPDPPPSSASRRLVVRAAATTMALGGLVLAARTVAVDRLVHRSWTAEDPVATIERATDVAGHDPGLATVLVGVREDAARQRPGDPEAAAAALDAAERTISIDPTLTRAWVDLGRVRAEVGPGPQRDRLLAARDAYLTALERNPWSRGALEGLLAVDRDLGREDDRERWAARLCQIDPCPLE